MPESECQLVKAKLVHTHRDGADPECEDVGERSDGDGDAGVLHRQPDPLRDRRDGLLLFRQVVVALHIVGWADIIWRVYTNC